ncbi:hypothetical protein ABZ816_34505 [Actinosynnema sp. NPDC047251]|uniref:Uncharacterized protein n=1 Tax=Saccharothrix espanaensis (strain ATCC 51144 / DSM 44229 / JCM 9112 / NBRC 15066 / NRRL 15764) TaxID=1179773 RepID=K0K3N5_SACES|nr:hypothetical protein [Saccharothrix espanaensis]CCH32187.1 hypothetical protein BN6_49170 [Saccharothrix espanaensis DSM 44229]
MADKASETRFPWFPAFWVLLAIAWIIAVPWLALQAAFTPPSPDPRTSLDMPRTSGDFTERDALFGWVRVAAIVLPLLGVVVATIGRRWTAVIVTSSILVFSTGYIALKDDRRPYTPPAPTAPHTPICQEHSGGDNKCPGN